MSAFPGFEATQNLQYLSTARKVFANDRVYGEWEVVEHSSEKPSQGDILDLSQIKEELQTIENDDEGSDFLIENYHEISSPEIIRLTELVEIDSDEQDEYIEEIAEQNSPATKVIREVIIFLRGQPC